MNEKESEVVKHSCEATTYQESATVSATETTSGIKFKCSCGASIYVTEARIKEALEIRHP